MVIRVAILIVSDTASINPTADLSGPKIREIVSSTNGFQVLERFCCIVPDEKENISRIVQDWTDGNDIDWVITTGGTGFGVRDVTPEALSPLIERHAPGLVHLMLSSSLKHTSFAALSRPVAGTIKNTLIVSLPGSVKAVKETLDALLQGGLISHAIDLIKGASSARVHTQLSAVQSGAEGRVGLSSDHSHDHDHHHHHHHGDHHAPKPRSEAALSHDPSAPVTARLRQSPFPIVSLENALELVRNNIQRLGVMSLPVNHKVGGHILAEDIYAPQDFPSTFTTSVDGYALRSTDPPGVYAVLTSQTYQFRTNLPPGCIYRINTGGPLPPGADTVIMVEDTQLVSVQQGASDAGGPEEEKEVRTLVQVPPFENVRKPGSDVHKGELVMKKGDRITRGGGEIGTLAFVGRREVEVYKKPVVAILSTGNEIMDLHSPSAGSKGRDGWGGIFDTNRPSLNAVLESMGYEILDLGIVPDDISAHLTAIKKGINEADLLLTTGGTSMGPTDLLKPLIERYLEGTIHFGRVSVKPGKPTTFATVPVSVPMPASPIGQTPSEAQIQIQEQDLVKVTPVFALPGNPASALVTFYVFVLPALRRMGGWPEAMCDLPRVAVQIQNDMPLDPRTEYHRVVIKSSLTSPNAVLKAWSTGGQRSSRVASLSQANGLVILPQLVTGDSTSQKQERLVRGDFATALLIGEIEME